MDLSAGPEALVAAWRDKAASLRRYAPEVANTLDDVAGELEVSLRDTGADLLTLQAAARETRLPRWPPSFRARARSAARAGSWLKHQSDSRIGAMPHGPLVPIA